MVAIGQRLPEPAAEPAPAVFLESCRGRKRGRLAVRRSQQQRLFGEQRLHALEVAGQESGYKLAI